MADQIVIEFVGDISKLARSSSRASQTLVKDMRGAEGDVGKSANRMADKFEDAFDGLHARVGRRVGPGFVSLGGQLGSKIAGGFAALGVGALIADRLTDGLNIDAGVDKLEARLGLTAKEAGKVGKLAGETYAGAWGDSLEEVQGFYAETMRLFPKLTDDALKEVTESAATVADVWDQDFNEVVRVAQQLLVNRLVPDAKTAMDQVATALQRTKGPQDEVLQALDEYTNHFAQLGLDGSAILGALTSEWATNQYAIDKVGDAVKELGIRTVDGSKTTKEGLDQIGLSVEEVEGAFAKGGETAQKMTERIIEGIIGIEDPAERARVGVALMGTPFEDLGNNAVPILEDVLGGVDDLTDTVETGNTAYDNAKTKIESFRREGLQKLTEFIGGTVVPVLEDSLLPAIEDEIIPAFEDFFDIVTDPEEGIPAVSAAVAEHLGVKVPDVLSASRAELKLYEQQVEEAKVGSIKSWGELTDFLESDSLSWGEKAGIIWTDIWDGLANDNEEGQTGVLNSHDNFLTRFSEASQQFARDLNKGWREMWGEVFDAQGGAQGKSFGAADSWYSGLLKRQKTFAGDFTPRWARFWNQNVLGKFSDFTRSAAWSSGWGRVHTFAAKGVNKVIDVINRLIGVWNRVSGAFGGPTISPLGKINLGVRQTTRRRPGMQAFAEGGQIPGGLDLASRDDVIARLSRGEWVMPTDAVDKYGPKFMEAIQKKLLPTDVLQDYAVGGQVRGLNADFFRRLVAYSEAINTFLTVVSGYRSTAQQAALYRAKPGLAAPPGRSLHERGIAADLSPQLGGTSRGNPVAGRFGLVYPMSYEPWHIQLASGRGGPGVFDFAQLIRDGVSRIFDRVGGDSLYDRLARAVIRTARDAMLDKVPSFADGTPMVTRDGLARVHRGEQITSGAAGSTVNITVNVNAGLVADRDRVVREVMTALRREVRRGFGGNVQAALGR